MIDAMTHQPLRVTTGGTGRSYIRVPESQLDDLTRLLADRQIGYEVDELSISWNGSPATTVVRLGRRVDVADVQRLLDGVG